MSTTTSTRYGKLQAEEIAGLSVFKGIPFAQPPVGGRRWLPPEKPASWNSTRDARNFAPIAPQNPVVLQALQAMRIEEPQSEDCLYLNIWTPKTGPGNRPVMVWLHGGAFAIGSGSQALYDGSTLARRGDVVVITVNYRLGPLGFLRLNDVTNGKIPSSGNEGLLDQIASLGWIRENVAEFGGDAGNITIFGESAGGMSVGCLMGMPSARGLFQRAIPQSGACHVGAPKELANKMAEGLLARLNVPASNINALRAFTPAELLKASLGELDLEQGPAYQPVEDGKDLPNLPINSVAQGSATGVALLVGSTLEEWKLFAAMDPSVARFDRPRLAARIGRRMPPELAEGLIATYERARSTRGDLTTPSELFSAIETDRIFRIPAVRLAEVQSNRGTPSVYSYLFTHRSPAMGGILGSCHALELGFVFGTNHLPGMESFAGNTPEVERLATQIQDTWLAFARTGNPGCESIGAVPVYDETNRATIVFGTGGARVERAPYDSERGA